MTLNNCSTFCMIGKRHILTRGKSSYRSVHPVQTDTESGTELTSSCLIMKLPPRLLNGCRASSYPDAGMLKGVQGSKGIFAPYQDSLEIHPAFRVLSQQYC